MSTAVDLFIKFAVALVTYLVSVHPELKANPFVAEIMKLIDALHLSVKTPA